ncbi:MAG: hypothetical protein HOV66_19880, partial [Streptomycetaceae bacterium]|nr:hypothetical protein [Streptomycetaceae bacterium]
MPGTMSRRQVLRISAAVALVGAAGGCSHHSSGHQQADTAGAGGPLDLLLRAVQASPDHLGKRSDDLVAAKQAAPIVAFVRDRVAVVPPLAAGAGAATARNWGSSATLRSGTGTLRDRAELLAELLNRAGFQTSVKTASLPSGIDTAALYRARGVVYQPDEALLAKFNQQMGGKTYTAPNQAPSLGQDPVAALDATIPWSGQKATLREDLLPQTVPLVVYTDAGKTYYAYALGDLQPATTAPSGLSDTPPPDETPKVSITVSGLANPAPGATTAKGKLINLVGATWPLEAIAGGRAVLSFVPAQGPNAFLVVDPQSVPLRVPVLRLQNVTRGSGVGPVKASSASSPAPSPSPSASLSSTPSTTAPDSVSPPIVMGQQVTLYGEVLDQANATGTTTPTGPVAGPFGPVVVLSEQAEAAAVARVAKVTCSADSAAFPEVDLRVKVTDGSGADVDGLDASAFSVTDNGKQVAASVLSNARIPNLTRLLIAWDSSVAWDNTAAADTFGTELGTMLAGAARQTPFVTQVVALGNTPAPDGWHVPDAKALTAAIKSLDYYDPMLWQYLAEDMVNAGPTAVVVVSDFEVDDDPGTIPGLRQRLAGASIPVFAEPTGGGTDTATLDDIVAASRGQKVDPGAAGAAATLGAALKPPITASTAPNYRLRYRAGDLSQGTHTVVVTVVGANGKPGPNAQTTYTPPATPQAPPSFIGLYATIEIAGRQGVRRLAGVPLGAQGQPDGDQTSAAFAAQTRQAMCGLTTIAVEPGVTCSAAVLDDLVTGQAALAPLAADWGKKPPQDLLQKVGPLRRVPGPLAVLLPP